MSSDYDLMTKDELIDEIMFLRKRLRGYMLPRFKAWLMFGDVSKKKLRALGISQEKIDVFPRPIK